MKVPYGWLQEFLPELSDALSRLVVEASGDVAKADLEAEKLRKLEELLSGLGLSVERVYDLPAPPAGVVVARVASVAPVPGSDHLLLAEVEDGAGRVRVVTGAPNTAVGLRTALAKPGTTLPAVGLEVAVRDVAGATSEGVLCSPRELGVYDYALGLIAFGEDAPVGAELAELWPPETVFELELTANRADAFSLLGVARDLSAKLGIPYQHPAAGLHPGDPSVDDGLTVRVEDPVGCPRFTLKRIDGVRVAPSPVWLQRRLAALGLRPRNNVVDVTNYVTFELGGPSHAYDTDDLTDGTIVVRRARAGETLVALNEAALEFSPEDLLITTPTPPSIPPLTGAAKGGGETQPIGVAGVIGGLHHSVKASTMSVALEVAHFDPVSVRKTAKRLGLSTDAHYRFERGVDPNLPPLASARAAGLIAQLGGGTLHPGFTEVGGDSPPREVPFHPSKVAFLTALEVPLDAQREFLERLSCEVTVEDEDSWRVRVPSWRFDLAIEEDLIEEVARLWGYEHIPQTVPTMNFVPRGEDVTHRGLRSLLVGLGFQEAMTYTFTNDEALARAAAPAATVRLESPPSAERSVLRSSLYPGLVEAARTNRGEPLVLFEVGRVFPKREEERLALLLRGPWVEGGWLPSQEANFFVLKGLLEKLAATLGASLSVAPKPFPALHPGVSAAVFWDGREVGFAGQLHPEVAAQAELGKVYLAELALPLPAGELRFRTPSRQPFAERDLAVIAPREVTYAELEALVRGAAGAWLESLTPFDVYEGPPIPEGKRSVALRLRFRHPARALEGGEVEADMENLIATLTSEGYSVRDR